MSTPIMDTNFILGGIVMKMVAKKTIRFLGFVVCTVFRSACALCGFASTIVTWICVDDVRSEYTSLLKYIDAVHGGLFDAMVHQWEFFMVV